MEMNWKEITKLSMRLLEMLTKYEGMVNFLKHNTSDIIYRQRKKIR